MKIEYINPKQLEVDEFNVRKSGYDSDDELVESIKTQGVIEPLIVREVKGKKKLQVVCGQRRMFASIEAKQKEIPIIKKQLSDQEALGLSVQENLARKSIDSAEIAEGVAKMWDMMNGSKDYDQKIKEIERMWGFKETSTNNYLAISRLSESFKKKFLHQPIGVKPKLDYATASEVATVKEWDDKLKEEAAEELSKIESSRERRKVLSEIKQKIKEQPELTPKKAIKEIKKVIGRSYEIYIPAELLKPFEKYCLDKGKDYKTTILEAIEKLLKKEGYLK